MLQLTGFGGVGQIGGNQFLLEDGEKRLLLDFGQPFGLRGRFYEEFLKPRSAFGLLDPLTMGLLPPLRGLYRPDLEPPAVELWDELRGSPAYRDLRDVEISGVLLSHAHLDHSGYLSFVRLDIPILASALTAFIAKSVQDSAPSDFEREIAYATPKDVSESGLLATGHYRRVAAKQRTFRVFGCEGLSEEAMISGRIRRAPGPCPACPWGPRRIPAGRRSGPTLWTTPFRAPAPMPSRPRPAGWPTPVTFGCTA